MSTKAAHKPVRKLRMDDALHAALLDYGQKTGIGNFSAVVRLACVNLLRTDGAFPTAGTAQPERVAR